MIQATKKNSHKWAILVMLMASFLSLPSLAEQKVQEDYHLTTYVGQQGIVSDIELFTKQAKGEVFFGVTCSTMSPFPLLQILLFNDEVLSEMPKFLSIDYAINGQKRDEQPRLQGILQVVDTADEYSNKVRLELEPGNLRTLALMNEGYQTLLKNLKAGQSIDITLTSRAFGSKRYQFSLKGLSVLLEPHQSVCR